MPGIGHAIFTEKNDQNDFSFLNITSSLYSINRYPQGKREYTAMMPLIKLT